MNTFIAENGPLLFSLVMLCSSLMILRIIYEVDEQERKRAKAVQDSWNRAKLDRSPVDF